MVLANTPLLMVNIGVFSKIMDSKSIAPNDFKLGNEQDGCKRKKLLR
jgi:hypothetical protein